MTQQSSSKESELQSLLSDERERLNQHKQLYQTLKEEHGKLKIDYGKLEEELRLVHEQCKEAVLKNEQIKESKDNYIKKLENQLLERNKEISRLLDEIKSYDAKKIRDSVLEEARNLYEIKIKELEVEADKAQEQYLTLHYEHAVLKCKHESRESEYSHSIERLKVQHLNEIQQLESKIELLDKAKSPDHTLYIDLEAAKYEILQLNSKLRAMLAECEELRTKNDNLSLQLSNTTRTQLKQAADNISNLRLLESEKQKAIMQNEVLEKELLSFQEQRRVLNNELQSSRREILLLKSQVEECEHKCQKMTTDLQVENERLKSDYQVERDHLIDEVTRLKLELKDAATELERTQQILMSKEQELQQNILHLRMELWKRSNEFDLEKEKMERKFQDFKAQKEQFISQLSHQLEMFKESLQMCSDSKSELEKECISLKEKLEETSKNTRNESAAELSKQNLEYEKEIQTLREQINHLKSTSNVYLEEKDRLLNDILSKQNRNKNEEDTEILQLKLTWEQEKYRFHQQIEHLESRLKETINISTADKKESELRIQRYSKAIDKLKDKLEHHRVKNEELEAQKEILEKNVPFEIYLEVKNRLSELQRRSRKRS